jgi:hypothetical protein
VRYNNLDVSKHLLLGAGLVLVVVSAAGRMTLVAQPMPTRAVVVAELFTSEGCSSCPPADDVLSRLASRQPIAGVEVLALGEHVDYWDQLGWRDRFSSATFSARQSDYDARVFRTGSLYTPQVVIDGRLQRLGSDSSAVQRAIEEAARAPKASVTITARPQGETIHVDVVVDVPSALTIHSADLIIAVTEDNLKTDVRKGENGGRILKHDGVVRRLQTIGALPSQARSWHTGASMPMPKDWVPEQVHVVALLQEHASRRIIGAGASTLK